MQKISNRFQNTFDTVCYINNKLRRSKLDLKNTYYIYASDYRIAERGRNINA